MLINMTSRQSSFRWLIASANTDIAVAFQRELLGSPLTGTDKDCCQFEGEIGTDEQGTFTFGVTWKLKQPLKL